MRKGSPSLRDFIKDRHPQYNDTTTANFEVKHLEAGWSEITSSIIKECCLAIYYNDQYLIRLVSSNNQKLYLAVGYLASEGFIDQEMIDLITIKRFDEQVISLEGPQLKKRPDIENMAVTPGLGKGTTFRYQEKGLEAIKISSSLKLNTSQVFHLIRELGERSIVYKATHGVHNAGLGSPDHLEIFQFDLGRHNAIDKLYGQCLMENIPIREKILVTSGRVSSEIIIKTALMGIPLLISRSAPTDMAIRLAQSFGVTLIARVRGNQMTIYSHFERVIQG